MGLLFTRKSILLEAPEEDNSTQQPQPQDAGTTKSNNNFSDAGDNEIDLGTTATQNTNQSNEDTNTNENPNDNDQENIDIGLDDSNSEERQKDREVYSSLSPQEQKVKTFMLKQNYSDLYNKIDSIIEKFDSLGIEFEDYGVPIKKSLDALYDLKEAISTYVLYLFDSNSYIENDIMFNRYLAVLNTIKLITDDIRDDNKDKIEEHKNLYNKEKNKAEDDYASVTIQQSDLNIGSGL